MADYSAHLVAVGDPDYPAKFTAFNLELEVDITALQVGKVPYSGATGHVALGQWRISAAEAVAANDLPTLAQVAAIVAGGPAGDIQVAVVSPAHLNFLIYS